MASVPKPEVGFVGLGAMGLGMATHLVKQGYPVTGFDVFPQALERFKTAGGIPAASIADSAKNKEFYICMVASAAQLEPLLFEGPQPLIDALDKGATFLVASTVPAHYVQHLEEAFKARGRDDILLVDCPVSGGAQRAADGTLSIMAGGSKEALNSAMPILKALSADDKLFLPGGIGAGSNLKVVHQVLAGIQILGTSEAMGYASSLGLDLGKARDAVVDSRAYSWMFENRSPRILTGIFVPPPSALTIILKDVGIITEAARLNKFPVPLCAASEQVYLMAIQQGFGSEDDAGVVRMYRPGLATPSAQPSESLSEQEVKERTQLVLDLLEIVHLVAAAEAIAFAHRLGLDLKQFVVLVNQAAGATAAFQYVSPSMTKELGNTDVHVNGTNFSISLETCLERLSVVAARARADNFPLHLGNAALGVLTVASRLCGQNSEVSSLVKYYVGS